MVVPLFLVTGIVLVPSWPGPEHGWTSQLLLELCYSFCVYYGGRQSFVRNTVQLTASEV